MTRKQSQKSQKAYGHPTEEDQPAAKTQGLFVIVSFGCILALAGCMYLQDQGYSMVFIAVIVFVLLILSLVARIISAFGDGFAATKRRDILRGKYGVIYVFIEAAVLLAFGWILLSTIWN